MSHERSRDCERNPLKEWNYPAFIFRWCYPVFFIPNPNFMLFNYTKSKRKPLFVTSTALKWNSLSRKQYTYYFPCPLGTRVKFILKSADIQSCALLIHKIYVLSANSVLYIKVMFTTVTLKDWFSVSLLRKALYSLNKTWRCLHTSCYSLSARLPVNKNVIVYKIAKLFLKCARIGL